MAETKALTEEFDVTDNADARRWEVREGDEVIAYAEYRLAPERVTFTHTVVEPEHEGRGIGTRLAKTVLDDALERGLRITPRCPFIRSYIERHREYMPSVDMPQAR